MILNVQLPQKTVIINKSQYKILLEDVYVNGLNKRKKQAQLTYDSSGSKINRGNLSTTDKLKTDKMNTLNGDTYEVPLKGGIMSYNITSIQGTEVMHYFKRHFAKAQQKTELSFKDENGNKELYELVMEDSELQRFVNDFKAKVKAVVDSKINDFTPLDNKGFSGISVYPVPSSSNFNIEMAKILEHTGFDGMKVQTINSSILKKDTSNLQKDTEFIEKNKEYYSSIYGRDKGEEVNYTHNDNMDTDLNMLKAHNNINNYIDELNQLADDLLKAYYARNKQQITPRQIEKIGNLYGKYLMVYKDLLYSARYYSKIDKKFHTRNEDKLINAIRYSKGPSIESRSGEIYSIANKSNSFKYYKFVGKQNINVCKWKPIDFEIKKFGNDTRMGLKNFYQQNKEFEDIKNEVNKTKNTIVIIFDDNISGGATLSDICMQLKNLGVENIIPITFGEMHQQWRTGVKDIYKPENGFNMNENYKNITPLF